MFLLIVISSLQLLQCVTVRNSESEDSVPREKQIQAQKALDASRQAYGRQDFEQALQLAREALGHDEGRAETHLLLAQIFDAKEQIPEAKVSLERSLELEPGNSAAWRLLGYILLNESRWAASIEASQRALQANSEDVAAQVNLGYALSRLGQVDRAYYHYQKALALAPRHKEALIYSGLLLTKMRRIDEARARFSNAARFYPDDAEAQFRLGELLATEVLPQIVSGTQSNSELEKSDAKTRRDHPRWQAIYQEAVSRLERSAALQSQLVEAYRVLLYLQLRGGDYPQAIANGKRAIAIEPRDAPTLFNLGLAHYHAGQYALARERFAQVLEAYPDTDHARLYLGNACMRLGDLSAAIDQFNAVLVKNPDNPEAHVNLWNIYRSLNQNAASERHREPACQAGVTAACADS